MCLFLTQGSEKGEKFPSSFCQLKLMIHRMRWIKQRESEVQYVRFHLSNGAHFGNSSSYPSQKWAKGRENRGGGGGGRYPHPEKKLPSTHWHSTWRHYIRYLVVSTDWRQQFSGAHWKSTESMNWIQMHSGTAAPECANNQHKHTCSEVVCLTCHLWRVPERSSTVDC